MSEQALAKIRENKRTQSPTLNLARCGLTELPDELFDCVWLEKLILSNRIWNGEVQKWELQAEVGPFNLLRNIPTKIQRLHALTHLYIGGSGYIYLGGLRAFHDRWPIEDISVLQGLNNLQSLSLSGSQIQDISVLQGLNNLQSLDLRSTKVPDISVLQGLNNLQSLSLSGSQIQDISVLQGLNNLQSLSLSGSQIQDISVLQGLNNLQSLDLRSTKVPDISVLQGLNNLQSLSLSGSQIQDISVLQGLNNLQSMDLSGSQIQDISVLQGLNNLQSLDLSYSAISDISVLQGLNNLQSLDLRSTKVSDISVLQGLNNLQSLSLRSTKVPDISVLQGLNNLQSLDLRSTKVSDISVLQGLNNLQSLSLSGSQIQDISVLQGLNNLQSLDLRSTKVPDISVLQGLNNLQSLSLSGSQIQDISVLQGLNNLQSMDLSGSQIQDISVLQGLNNLQSLDLSYSAISDISVLQGLNNLQSLSLSGSQIQDISVLQGLNNLQSLSLSGSQIQDISVLQGLNNLQSLDLRSTKVPDISVLQGLNNLQSLSLSGSQIQDISVLQGLNNLQSMDLSGSQIQDISVLQGLNNLQSLDLSYSAISDISVLQGLNNLQSLDLRSTKVSDISVLQGLNNLQTIDISNTEVTNLSPLLPLISQGIPVVWDYLETGKINVKDCPLTTPPIEIVKEGNQAILNYFAALSEGEETVYEAKLLIVGEAGTGKTTFSRKVRDCHAPMPEAISDTTRGIEIEPTLLTSEGEPDFTMNIWDFGGQDVYHGIHQLFLSKRSLYVLLLDGRIEENPHYWLQAQELFGKDSPLLVILNKKGTIRQNAPYKDWQQDYPNLKAYKEINLKDDIPQVQQLVLEIETEIRHLPHLQQGETLPKKWVEIRKVIDQTKETNKYIRIEAFQEICEQAGIKEAKRQDFLSDYLHDLGVLLHFAKEPQLKQILFLNTQWAIDAIYQVLDHTKEHEYPGHFTRQALHNIWTDKSYRNVFDELLALMQSFELCFKVPAKDLYIVPQLLPANKPDGYQWQKTDAELALRYQYDFLPKGIVPRLIVRLHHHLSPTHSFWKRGAVFQREGATAEVIEHVRDEYIHIRVKGRNRRRLLTIIAHQLDDINRSFQFSDRMTVHRQIPCHCRECQSEKPYYFHKENLDIAIQKEVFQVQCQKSYTTVSVKDLLEEVFWQDNTYKSYLNHPTTMAPSQYISQLLADGQLKAALQLLDQLSKGTYHHDTIIHLQGQYSRLESQVQQGTITFDNQTIQANKLASSIQSSSANLLQSHPELDRQPIPVSNPLPDPVTTPRPQAQSGNTYIFHAPVGSVNPDNQSEITQHIDQRQQTTYQIEQHLSFIRQLVEAEHAQAYIDQDTYEEITEILDDIQANPEPQNDRQKRKWKRWLGKAFEAGKKFVKGRTEKGIDTVLSEELKTWIKDGGYAQLGDFIENLV